MSYVQGFGDEVIVFLLVWVLCCSATFGALWLYCRTVRSANISDALRADIRRRAVPANFQRPTAYGSAQDDCPICLNNLSEHSVTTNCGHTFDLMCFLSFWEHHQRRTNTKCPCCRQRVNLLFPNFDDSSPDSVQQIGRIRRFNRLHGSLPRTSWQYITDAPELIRRILVECFSTRGLRLATRFRLFLLFIFALLYLLSPLDLIPEGVFGIVGFVDDLFIMLSILILASVTFRQAVVRRNN